MLIRTRNSEYEIHSLRCFYFRSRLLGEACASLEAHPIGNAWIDTWCSDDERTSFIVTVGHWMLAYDIPKWLLPKRHASKVDNAIQRRLVNQS